MLNSSYHQILLPCKTLEEVVKLFLLFHVVTQTRIRMVSYRNTDQHANLVDGYNSISDVVQSDLAIPIHVQNVKGLLRLLRLQEMLQILRQNVRPAYQMLPLSITAGLLTLSSLTLCMQTCSAETAQAPGCGLSCQAGCRKCIYVYTHTSIVHIYVYALYTEPCCCWFFCAFAVGGYPVYLACCCSFSRTTLLAMTNTCCIECIHKAAQWCQLNFHEMLSSYATHGDSA